MTDPRAAIPRTDTVLADPRLAAAVGSLGRDLVKAVIVAAQQRARAHEIAPEAVPDEALATMPDTAGSLRRVLNATGVLVHTNLGRAPLSTAAIDAVRAAAGTVDVEFDLRTGQRARRGAAALAALEAAVPGVGGAHVVNNNAAALLLCALALAPGKEIVISRSELVEIGDGFRVPELLESTGARLREVGTTNRTSAADYADAINADTGFLLKVHPSNFRINGFTARPDTAELCALGPPVVVDIGSGLLAPHPRLPEEPDAATAVAAGASVVTASADKLLGGPQAGLLLGTAELIARLRRHPAARGLRVDKLTLAALEATLRGPAPPVRRALEADVSQLRERAGRIARALDGTGIHAEPVETVSTVGGGGAPGVELPSAAVSLPERFAAALRVGDPPVVGRLRDGRCLLDLRTIEPAADDELTEAVRRCT